MEEYHSRSCKPTGFRIATRPTRIHKRTSILDINNHKPARRVETTNKGLLFIDIRVPKEFANWRIKLALFVIMRQQHLCGVGKCSI